MSTPTPNPTEAAKQPEEETLEQAATNYSYWNDERYIDDDLIVHIVGIKAKKAFKAGAEWQSAKDQQQIAELKAKLEQSLNMFERVTHGLPVLKNEPEFIELKNYLSSCNP